MSTEVSPGTVPSSGSDWLVRLGTSGKLLLGAATVGVISCFLPVATMTFESFGQKASQSAIVIKDWRGVITLLGYLAVVGLVYVLYLTDQRAGKELTWATLGVGALVALLALWLLLSYAGGETSLGFAKAKLSAGSGAFLNLLAGLTVVVGGGLKAREEKLF